MFIVTADVATVNLGEAFTVLTGHVEKYQEAPSFPGP
jgi:hypothetical protein